MSRIILVSALLLWGCGDGTPSEAMAREAFANNLASRDREPSLVSFRKTDGQAGEVLGVKLYTLEFAAVVANTQDFGPTGGLNFPIRYFCRGDQSEIEGQVLFELKESGWNVAEVKGGVDVVAGRDQPCPITPEELDRLLGAELNNLATQQELYYADNRSYSNDLRSLGFVESSAVSVTIHAGPDFWAASAVHSSAATRGCSRYHGNWASQSTLIGAPAEPDRTACTPNP